MQFERTKIVIYDSGNHITNSGLHEAKENDEMQRLLEDTTEQRIVWRYDSDRIALLSYIRTLEQAFCNNVCGMAGEHIPPCPNEQ